MRFLCAVVAALFVFSGVCQAEEVAGHQLRESEEIVQDMSSKLCRGVSNVLTGWGELPRQMVKSGKEKGWWAVLPVGIPAGAIMTLVRTGTGAFETLTFMVPIDDSYGPIIDPAFVWQKAEGD